MAFRKTKSKKYGGGPTMSKHTRKKKYMKKDENKQKTKEHMTEVSKKLKDSKHWENRNAYYKKKSHTKH